MLHMTKPNDIGLKKAQAFHREHGHLRVPTMHVTSCGYQLGRWLSKQRVALKDGLLCPVRKKQLDSIGMIWDVHQFLWETGLQEARQFQLQHDHLLVHKGYVSPSGHKLGEWVRNRRKNFVAGLLDSQRQAELEQLGMVWTARTHQWQVGLNAAKEHFAEHGHLQVSQARVGPGDFCLAAWLKARRKEHAEGRLSDQRKALLDALGMTWSQSASRRDAEQGTRAASSRRARSVRSPKTSRSSKSKGLSEPSSAPDRTPPAGHALHALCLSWSRPSTAIGLARSTCGSA